MPWVIASLSVLPRTLVAGRGFHDPGFAVVRDGSVYVAVAVTVGFSMAMS